ncbi:GDSL esterase/lipase [Rhynchospora pubera]|uniref:GDSL esterase/lipase n=1 Tax=Rhynchospora pubera TaxID=906938 RepID=A0AAV8FDQ2_9POAL|nr:GDSL esterase/lipase [Rhynchospora pubera]
MKQPLCLFFVLFCVFSRFVGATTSYTWKVPAIYVFGDSTVDVGNNNYLTKSKTKANYPHYGIDFPHSRPTGRFSNGYNQIDFVAIHMGFRISPPPYLSLNDTNNHQILKGLRGVNFASAGSGILDSTGANIITGTQQLLYFETLRSKMMAQPNADQVAQRLSMSLFLISAGGNDALAFFATNNSPNNSAVLLFYNTLLSKYENHIKTLYRLGARRFAVINVPPVGCVPSARVLNLTGGCINGMNQIAKGLNDAITALFSKLAVALPGLKYSIGASYDLTLSAITNPLSFGFKEVGSACCGSGKLNAQSYCTRNATYCMNRKQYLFWDLIHPTQQASKIAASVFYNGSAQFVGPITYKQLVYSDN